MSNILARSALTAYRWTGAAVYPLLGPYLAYRASKGKEERPRRNERYGRAKTDRPKGPLIWFHAASVGETLAIVPLIEQVYLRGMTIVLTTGTVTSANIIKERLGDKVIHQYVPLDLKPAVSNFLNHWRPDLVIICESEIWPMTILELGARKIPQIQVNGRLSDRSFAAWNKQHFLADALFENISHVVAQSDLDAERFSKLGVRSVSVSGNLKVDTQLPPHDSAVLNNYLTQISGRPSWAATSTFEGEEKIAADIHKSLRVKHPDILTIIVPRHVKEADRFEQYFQDKGHIVARRSRNDVIGPETDIFLGDTIGEMGMYLGLTDIVFVGKSLEGTGGHNPLEPAMLDCCILTGPNVENFREVYKQLLKNGAARVVKDSQMLSSCVDKLISEPEKRKAMIKSAHMTLDVMRGSLDKTMQSLEPYLMPLMLESGLQRPKDDA